MGECVCESARVPFDLSRTPLRERFRRRVFVVFVEVALFFFPSFTNEFFRGSTRNEFRTELWSASLRSSEFQREGARGSFETGRECVGVGEEPQNRRE